MLMDLGHTVYFYGSEGSNPPCTEHIVTHTLREIREEWGEGDNRFEIGYDWKSTQFKHDLNQNGNTELWKKFNERVIRESNKRRKPDDFVICMQGYYQKPILDALDLFLTVEPGIGYRGSVPKLSSGKTVYRGFESTYIMHFTYGSQFPFQSVNGANYDRVVPNYFDGNDFKVGKGDGDYYFFIGRLISRKGIMTAILATQALGKKLIIAGQPDDSEKINLDYPHVEYVGYVEPEERTKLMGGAIATFVPTDYLEPFAGTHIESTLCGTPVLTTDFGVFPDTVINGVNGYRCHTLNDFVQRARDCSKLDRKVIKQGAERYLTSNMQWELEKWFRDLYQLYLSTDGKTKGWGHIEMV
jgi:glycosyltransferase involved in cell wall biosynthesis